MLSTGETYRDLGGDYFINRDPKRQTKRLVKQLERLGHHVTLTEGPRQPERTFMSGRRDSSALAKSALAHRAMRHSEVGARRRR